MRKRDIDPVILEQVYDRLTKADFTPEEIDELSDYHIMTEYGTIQYYRGEITVPESFAVTRRMVMWC